MWIGGALGVLFVGGSVFIAPRIGAAAYFVCLVCGQLLAGAAIDAAGAFGVPVRTLDASRAAGILLVIAAAAAFAAPPALTARVGRACACCGAAAAARKHQQALLSDDAVAAQTTFDAALAAAPHDDTLLKGVAVKPPR